MLPYVYFAGSYTTSLLFNQALGADWEVRVSSEPPADHVVELPDSGGLYGSIEVPLAYSDADDDGRPGPTELLYGACSGTDVGGFLWLEGPTDLEVASAWISEGLTPGWLTIALLDKGLDILDETAATSLVIGGDCSLE